MDKEDYRTACIDFAFEFGLDLTIRGNCAVLPGYEAYGIPDTILCVPTSPEALWSETWTTISERLPCLK
jgi:hypothetical protein